MLPELSDKGSDMSLGAMVIAPMAEPATMLVGEFDSVFDSIIFCEALR
jgi:hypothetical protein